MFTNKEKKRIVEIGLGSYNTNIFYQKIGYECVNSIRVSYVNICKPMNIDVKAKTIECIFFQGDKFESNFRL